METLVRNRLTMTKKIQPAFGKNSPVFMRIRCLLTNREFHSVVGTSQIIYQHIFQV